MNRPRPDTLPDLAPIRPASASGPRTLASNPTRSLRRATSATEALEIAALLRAAAERGARVSVVLRGDVLAGRDVRMIEGVPLGFRAANDGRERVVVETVAGETAQTLLLERIARVSIVAA